MKWFVPCIVFAATYIPACSQTAKNNADKKAIPPSSNTLLWKISGNGLQNPSYLYGTIHMICGSDAGLSTNFKDVIAKSDAVYLEVDMDNLFEMLGAVTALQMKGDTTLEDLYSPEEYERVKKYFHDNNSMIPFDMLKQFKPMLASSLLDQKGMQCDDAVAIEQLIMEEARKSKKSIKGLETLKYQASVLDSIPYKMQAMQLLAYIDSSNAGVQDNGSKEMMDAYKDQDLKKLETLMMTTEPGMNVYYDILLYNRNRNWVRKLKDLLPQKSLVIAVGAGHLPGEKGVINLLKKEGYEVTPVENKIVKTKEI
jgi:uncharacterized protein YbaP (TraB family)